MFEHFRKTKEPEPIEARIQRLKTALQDADAVIIGAGAGLSAAAGYTYAGARFERHSGTSSRNTASRTCIPAAFIPLPRSGNTGRGGAVLTTNVDHCFQRAGFDKQRLFYTQGDYGLWQCSRPCHDETYDNEETVHQMLLAQGFAITENGELETPDWCEIQMAVPTELVPRCPRCGRPMTMNLCADDTFVEDAGWQQASGRYQEFLRAHEGQRLVYWEIGVGYNTPVIIKYPFWRRTAQNPNATYVCMSRSHADCPDEIRGRSICLAGDAHEILRLLK